MALPLISLPSLGFPALVLLFVLAVAIPVAIYWYTARRSDSERGNTRLAVIVGGVLLTIVGLLALSSFGLPSLPQFGFVEWLAIIIASTIPLAAYLLIQLTRVIHWSDVVVFIGLTLIPAATILGLLGHLTGAAVTGIIGILSAHALGIIDTD